MHRELCTNDKEPNVLPEPLKQLLRRVPNSSSRTVASLLNFVIGFAVPCLALLSGHLFQLLAGQPVQALSGGLPGWAERISERPPLMQVSFLLAAAIGILLVTQLLLYFATRLNLLASVNFEIALLEKFKNHSTQLARVRTLSGQETELDDCLNYHVPRVRTVLARYWQVVPRHIVQFLACMLVACLIHLQFTLLAIIATALLMITYQWLDRIRRTKLPVVRENATLHRGGLVNLVLRGPILESVHDQQELQNRFNSQLNLYRRDASSSLTSSAWKTPVVALFLGVLTCLLVFIMSVQLMQQSLQLPSALAFLLCLAAAVFSSRRLLQFRKDGLQITSAVEELNRFLSTVVPQPSEQHQSVVQRVTNATLEHVTVHDSRGRKLLEDISVSFGTGSLIGVVSSQPIEARALVEMLLGFGQPTSGRMLIDNQLVTDIEPSSLTRAAHWVAADGAVLTGSVLENLAPNGQSVEPILRKTLLTELVTRLPDGVNTLITADDDRLQQDDAFRLGLARALFSQASVVVIEEPIASADATTEHSTLQAVQSLVDPERITLVLPTRLGTIRSCGKLLFVHQHRLMDSGTHAELLQRSELYRHLSYLRFNPFGAT